MTSVNCLEGIRCPNCGQADRLFITATIRADVTDDGADIADGSGMHWDDASLAICPECDMDGPLAEFRIADCPVCGDDHGGSPPLTCETGDGQ